MLLPPESVVAPGSVLHKGEVGLAEYERIVTASGERRVSNDGPHRTA
jgi:hypothetical protein